MKPRFFLAMLLCCTALVSAQISPDLVDDPFQGHPVARPIKIIMALMCSSFMGLSAFSFLRFRLRKKAREYQNLLSLFQMDGARFHTPSVEGEYAVSDYVLPVSFATSICLFFFVIIFLGHGWEVQMEKTGSVIITALGHDFIKPALVGACYAFLGAYLWSANNITRRLLSADLSPGIYYSTGLRILYACFVSLILTAMLHSTTTDVLSSGLLPATAFLTGMLPDQALRYVKERIRVFSNKEHDASHPLELEMIEGINLFHKTRLGEIGIDNAQNLAEANMIELMLKTPFSPRQILDWIAQARLYLYVTNEITRLRKIGLRSIFDIYNMNEPETLIPQIAREAGISELLLRNIWHRVCDDPDIEGLWYIHQRLAICGAPEETGPRITVAPKKVEQLSQA